MQPDELLELVQGLWSYWSRLLGVTNWTIAFEVADNGGAISVGRVPFYHKALVSIKPDSSAEDLTDEGISKNVLHEVCHLLLADVQDRIDREFDSEGLMFAHFRQGLEASTDIVAAAIWRLTHDA